MSRLVFNAHGDHQVIVRHRCVQVCLIGPFNKEGARAVFDMLRQVVEQHFPGDETWAALIDQTRFELATPDIGEMVSRIYQWNAAHGQRCEALVAPGTFQQEQSSQLARQYGQDLRWKAFENIRDAEVWLSELGYL